MMGVQPPWNRLSKTEEYVACKLGDMGYESWEEAPDELIKELKTEAQE